MKRAVYSISVPPHLCGLGISAFSQEHAEEDYIFTPIDGLHRSFTCWTIPKNSSVWNAFDDYFFPLLQNEFEVMRIHKWFPDDAVDVHIDNAYPNCDTVIIRLDGYGEPRLVVNGWLMDEKMGRGYVIPEGTPHAVIPATDNTERYTFVGWIKNEKSV